MTKPKKKGKPKTAPFVAYPAWSEAKFYGFLRSGLRAKASRWPPKYEVLNASKRPYSGPNKRQKYECLCAKCGNYYPLKEVQVDHVVPAGSLTSFDDLPGFVQRLFCGTDGLQVLCSECHKEKTASDRAKVSALPSDKTNK